MNPYQIQPQSILRISGGRTSAFMLRQILDAHGGALPPKTVAVFCNTGKEHESALNFMHELETRWCPIVWLEYRWSDGAHAFVEVDYCHASRNGEPFDQVIAARSANRVENGGEDGTLPTPRSRFCTTELKIRTSNRYAKTLGWDYWTSVVGLRADEPSRAQRIKGDCADEDISCPMYRAGHTEADVLAFWKTQPFDLLLPNNDHAFGNCDLCFLKKRAKIEKIIQTDPKAAEWWAQKEELAKCTFRIDRPSYRNMIKLMAEQWRIWQDQIEDETLPCACTD